MARSDPDVLSAALEQEGYFKHLSPGRARELKTEFEQRGWGAIFSESHRFYNADAEDLAEGGIGNFILSMSDFLSVEGVALAEIEDDFSEKGYTVRVGGIGHVIYDDHELSRDMSGEGGLIWGLAMTRAFRIVDEMLAAAGSRERVYAVNGGNDLFALLLTPEMHRIISEHPAASAPDGPYRPTERYPAFGQPRE